MAGYGTGESDNMPFLLYRMPKHPVLKLFMIYIIILKNDGYDVSLQSRNFYFYGARAHTPVQPTGKWKNEQKRRAGQQKGVAQTD